MPPDKLGTSNSRWSLFAVGLLTALCCGKHASFAGDQEFSPVSSNLLGNSTVRSAVDIEVVGSTSVVPHEHRLEPERRLRFRLERAYVTNFMTKEAPGYSLLTLSYDQPSGLPNALIAAVMMRGRFHQDIPGVPDLDREEALRRHIILNIRSDRSTASRRQFLQSFADCVGEAVGNDLFQTTRASACSPSVYPDGQTLLAKIDDVTIAVVECQGDDRWTIGCSMNFDFQDFSVGMTFHRSNLAQWRSLIASAREFLASHQVR